MTTLKDTELYDEPFAEVLNTYGGRPFYRIGNDLKQVAYEMGNSPREIIDSYRRDVTDQPAKDWFSIVPPDDYHDAVSALLKSRKLL